MIEPFQAPVPLALVVQGGGEIVAIGEELVAACFQGQPGLVLRLLAVARQQLVQALIVAGPECLAQGMGQAPETLVAFVLEQAAGHRQAAFRVRRRGPGGEIQAVQLRQGGGVPGRQIAQHLRGRVEVGVQVQHHPGQDAQAEVVGERRQGLGHQQGIGVVDAEMEGGFMGPAPQAAAPLQKPAAPAFPARAGEQPG